MDCESKNQICRFDLLQICSKHRTYATRIPKSRHFRNCFDPLNISFVKSMNWMLPPFSNLYRIPFPQKSTSLAVTHSRSCNILILLISSFRSLPSSVFQPISAYNHSQILRLLIIAVPIFVFGIFSRFRDVKS